MLSVCRLNVYLSIYLKIDSPKVYRITVIPFNLCKNLIHKTVIEFKFNGTLTKLAVYPNIWGRQGR